MAENEQPNRVAWDFLGQVAIVTGANRGIGEIIARRLAALSAEVHVFDVEKGDLGDEFENVHCHAVDVTDAASVAAVMDGLDPLPTLLVNNAGITRDRTIAKMSDEEWQAVIDVNLTGAFNMIRAAAPLMAEVGGGSIVNITSINGIRGKFGQANYSAAKAGMIGLTKTAAREFGAKGVNVNAVAPGMVMTEMAEKLPQEILDKALGETVTKWLAEPDDIANAVLFLLSDAARAVTGQVLQVDCGQYL